MPRTQFAAGFNPLEGAITTFSFVGLPVYRQETIQEDPPSPLDLQEMFQTDYEQDPPPPTSLELYEIFQENLPLSLYLSKIYSLLFLKHISLITNLKNNVRTRIG